MATELLDRPVLNELGDSITELDRPPMAVTAILAFAAGLLSLLSPLTMVFIPLSFAAAVLGLVTLIRFGNDRQVGGQLLAQLGLGLGIATGLWSLLASNAYSDHLVNEAGSHAKMFLDLVSDGEKYQALELKKELRLRQIAGTNLEQYYRSLTGETAMMNEAFFGSRAMQRVTAAGPSAEWKLVRCVELIKSKPTYFMIDVEMANQINPEETVTVKLNRIVNTDAEGVSTADWNISDVTL